MSLLLNLAATAGHSLANGPGARAVLWVQGCSLHCKGCHNARTWAPEPRRLATVDSVLAWFKSKPGLRGLTLSGGEPFEQALALAAISREVRALGADVITFSGFTLEEIERGARPHAEALLRETDLLVDGRFLRDQPTTLPLRGSANQRLHFLSARIRPDEIEGLPRGEWLGDGAGGVVSGFALKDIARLLQPCAAGANEGRT
ncbi:MAG: radical SAM protein [Rubrivivax sp.]|nr:radical SAM protein [Rubrivivax sp.]